MQDATENECTRGQDGVISRNKWNKHWKKITVLYVSGKSVRYLRKKKIYIYIYKFVGHSVFVACHQEGLYKQIPSPRVMP